MFSGGFFQCATWVPLSAQLYYDIHHAVFYIYRIATKLVLAPSKINNMFSDSDLIYEYGLVSPYSMMRSARLSLFARVAMKSPKCIVDLFDVMLRLDFGWLGALRVDLAWFACSGLLSVSPGDLPSVFQLVASSPKYFVTAGRSYSVSRFANFDVPTVYPNLAPLFFACKPALTVIRAFVRFRTWPCIER